MKSMKFIVNDNIGTRLDVYLSGKLENVSRSQAQKLLSGGCVLINGSPAKSNYKLSADDEIDLTLADSVPSDILPEDIPLDVRYEDEFIMVINKPKGMTVHPAPGSPNQNPARSSPDAMLHSGRGAGCRVAFGLKPVSGLWNSNSGIAAGLLLPPYLALHPAEAADRGLQQQRGKLIDTPGAKAGDSNPGRKGRHFLAGYAVLHLTGAVKSPAQS